MFVRSSVLAVLTLATFTIPAGAQGPRDVPEGHRPPPGLCRIWIDGVPPGRQPRATDCRTAERERPRNARVIYGDWYVPMRRDRDRDGRDDRYEQRDRDRDGRWDRRDRDNDRWDDRRRNDRRDGRWDDRDRDRRGSEWCRDADRNGRCDSPVLRRRLP